ncbi:hypothetical protein QTP86_027162 [Hemibagrus guttatus]|nr:hypothetical protein QTP86_027162 [Hemibagrus guttatus]
MAVVVNPGLDRSELNIMSSAGGRQHSSRKASAPDSARSQLCEDMKTETSDGGTEGIVKKEEILELSSSNHGNDFNTPDDKISIKEEGADDKDFLYCEACQSFFFNKCEVHGPAVFIPDTPVPMGVTDRARRTLPSGLEIQKSGIPDAGLGVFNKGETVPVGAHFGPYQGELVDSEEAMNSGYSWVGEILRGAPDRGRISVVFYSTNHIVKFADDMTVVGLITNNNKPIHRSEKRTFTAPPLTINGAAVERVNSTKFLGVYISEDLSLMTNTTLLAKKVQSRLYFLHKLRKAQVPPPSCAPSTRTLYLCVVWRLHCLLSKDSATHRECSKQGHQCLSALPCGYLPHPPHWQCHQHRSRWFTPVKPTLQPPIFREKIYISKQCEEYIDAKRDMYANWMRYVNCARHDGEQNLVAFQYRGGILYRCCRPIKPGQELLLWYEENYARNLGPAFHHIWNKKCSSKGKGRELADMMERRKVDILCVQETRWKGSKAHSIGAGFKLFYYGVDSKRNGVGVVLKEEFVRNVLEVKRVSDRVMSLKLEIEGVIVVSGYALQVGCELEEKERFWSELDKVMESIPRGERVVIGADFNGHVGEGNRGDEEVMGKFGVKERNLEGQMVVDFAKRMDMGVVNTYFQKREEHRVTYKSGDLEKAYDKVPREELWYCMRKSEVAEKYVRVVQDMYKRSRTVEKCTVGQTGVQSGGGTASGISSEPLPVCYGDGPVVRGELTDVLLPVFSCSLCTFSYTSQIYLDKHMKRCHYEEYLRPQESGEIKYEVQMPTKGPRCQQTSSDTLSSDTSHKEIHKEVHHCSDCGKRFTHLGNLQRHQNIHKGVKPHHCTQCGKSFIRKDHLQQHQRIHAGEKLHRCLQCGRTFNHQSHLQQHQRIHTGEKPYPCSQCGKSFADQSSVQRHQRIHTGEKPYQCTQCGKRFRHQGNLQRHQLIHTGEKPYHCSQCGKCFSQHSHFQQHQRIHTGEKPYHCSQCGKSFTHQDNLQQHQRIHTGEKLYLCSQCGKGFTDPSNLRRHRRIHTGEKPHHCSQCGKSFIQKVELRLHQRIHTGEKPYNCSQCGKSFSHQSYLKQHYHIHTGEKPYRCSACGKSFIQKSALQQHQLIHTGEKTHHCSQCDKSFTDPRNLKRHQRIHTGEKPYNCAQCGKSFVQKIELQLHQRIHTGEKPYNCSQCGKSFKRKDHLLQHKGIHTGVKPYYCSQCGKSFIQKAALQQHQRIHTGEKTHHCLQCDKSFADPRNLKRHQRIHTGEKPYNCSQCGKNFKRKDHLLQHKSIHTGERTHHYLHNWSKPTLDLLDIQPKFSQAEPNQTVIDVHRTDSITAE